MDIGVVSIMLYWLSSGMKFIFLILVCINFFVFRFIYIINMEKLFFFIIFFLFWVFNCFKMGSELFSRLILGLRFWLIFLSSSILMMILIKFFFRWIWCCCIMFRIFCRILLILMFFRVKVWFLILSIKCCIFSVNIFLFKMVFGCWYCLYIKWLVL